MSSESKYRAYFFQNMYLQGIHAGVQSQHTTAEMFIKYMVDYTPSLNKVRRVLRKWAIEDKTTIVLNGGMSGDLQELVDLFSEENNPYPWSFFKETDYALNGTLTNIGIILPERVYTYDKVVDGDLPVLKENRPVISEFEMKVVEVLRGRRLMS